MNKKLLALFLTIPLTVMPLAYGDVTTDILSGSYNQALIELSKQKASDKVYRNYAVVYSLLGRLDEANKYYTLASKIKPSAVNYYNQSLLYFYSNNLSMASSYLTKALKLDKKYLNAIILNYKLKTLTTQEYLDDALLSLKSKNKTVTAVDDLIVFYYLTRHNISKAMTYADKYKPARYNYYYALFNYLNGDKNKALAYCKKIKTSDTEGRALYFCLLQDNPSLTELTAKCKLNLGLYISLCKKLIYMNKTINIYEYIDFVNAYDKDFYRGFYLKKQYDRAVASSVYCANNYNAVSNLSFDSEGLKYYLSNFKRKDLFDFYLNSLYELHVAYIKATGDYSLIENNSFYKERTEVKSMISN